MKAVELQGLTRRFKDKLAVDHLNLSLEEGELFALLGVNGAGKTTTLRAITGMVKAYGSVHLGETEILGQRGYKTARMGVNMSPEGRLIFAGLTVEENLKAGAYCIKSAKQYQKNMDRVQELFPILRERRRQQAGTLSGGEQQMLAIGRALMADPEILLLDEITAALDPEMVREVLDVVLSLAKAGSTMVIVTHEMNFARAIADRILFIENGAVVEQSDDPKAFFASPETDRAKAFLKSFDYE